MNDQTTIEALEEALVALLAVSTKLNMEPFLDIQVNSAIITLTKLVGEREFGPTS